MGSYLGDLYDNAKTALEGAGNQVPGVRVLKGAYDFAKPAQANLQPAQQAQAADMALAQGLGGQRGTYGSTPLKAGQVGAPGTGFNTPGLDPNYLYRQQMGAMQGLVGAANGTAPSAAEQQLRQQSSRNLAQQYALAATLQGRSPGGALMSAQQGAAQVQGDTNAQAAQLRAQEQATARGQLQQALQAQTGLQQVTNQLNAQQYNALLAAQLQAMGYGTQAGIGLANASAQAAAGQNAYKGALIGGVAGGFEKLAGA